MEVFVKVPMTNEIFAIEVGYNETVMSVKEKIEAETEYKNSKLFFEGIELPDSEELVAHGVAEGDELVSQFEQGVLNRLEKEMYEAVTLEQVDVLKKNYLLLGINNGLTFRSASLLHLAAVYSKPTSTKTLLSLGADVNARNLTTKATPLHNAAASAEPTVVELLLSAGADPKACDRRNNNALHYAVRNKYYYYSVIILLLSAGTPIDQQNVRLKTPAHIASYVSTSVLDVLVQAGCDITLADDENRPIIDTLRCGGCVVFGDYADSIDAVVHAPSKGSVVEEPWEKSNGYARRHCRGAKYHEVTRAPKRTYPYNPMSVRIRMGFNPHVGERHVAKEVGFSGLLCAARSSAVSYLDAAKK